MHPVLPSEIYQEFKRIQIKASDGDGDEWKQGQIDSLLYLRKTYLFFNWQRNPEVVLPKFVDGKCLPINSVEEQKQFMQVLQKEFPQYLELYG